MTRALDCAEGHPWDWEVRQGRVPARCPVHSAEWRRRRGAERYAEWARANPARAKEKSARYYRENRERVISRTSEYHAKNAEHYRAYSAEYYAANRDRRLAENAAWARNNGEARAAAAAARRARKAASPESDPTLTWRRVAERDGMECAYCPTVCDPEDYTTSTRKNGAKHKAIGPTHPTLDHIVPLVRGGAHSMDNAVLACRRCNAEKGAMVL